MSTGTTPTRPAGAGWALGGFAGALALALASPAAGARSQQLAVQARLALLDLGTLAGLRDDTGQAVVTAPIRVMVVQDGGPTWVHEAVERAASRDPVWAPIPTSPHLLRLTVVEGEATMAVGLALYRQGWNLARPQPLRLQHTPSTAIVAAAAGTAVARRWGARAWGLLAAGLLAQLGSRWATWPEPPGSGSWGLACAEGPLGLGVRMLASRLSEDAEGWLVGLVVACLVLVAFDHRRSRDRGGRWLVGRLVGVFGAVTWLEATSRTGWLGFALTPFGFAAAILVIVAAWLGTRRAWGSSA